MLFRTPDPDEDPLKLPAGLVPKSYIEASDQGLMVFEPSFALEPQVGLCFSPEEERQRERAWIQTFLAQTFDQWLEGYEMGRTDAEFVDAVADV
jgi:hypothetical protein